MPPKLVSFKTSLLTVAACASVAPDKIISLKSLKVVLEAVVP